MDTIKVYIDSLSRKIDYIESEITNLKTTTVKNHKVVKTSLDDLKSKYNFSIWTPIIAALISAIVGTLLAQLIDRWRKSIADKDKELREIKSKCVNLLVRLKESYRQLAMYKFHAQYWWHCHVNEQNNKNSDAYYNYHLNSQIKAQNAEEKIGEFNADFHAEITKYERLKGKSFNVDQEKRLINNIEFQKAKEYPPTLSHDDLRNIHAETDEKELRDSYYLNLNYYQQIIDKM